MRFLVVLALSLLLVLVSIGVGGWLAFRRSLPQEPLTINVPVRDSVSVWRDSFAIPTIVAPRTLDAFFALGYLHAQDRLWQMELARRIAQGRLAEVLGPEALPLDYLMRTIDFSALARRLWDKLSPLSRSILRRYTAGVNAWLEQNSGRLPPEFLLLGYKPEPWQELHSLAIARLMAFDLAFCFWTDIAMGTLAEELGMERAAELIPDYPPTAPTITEEVPPLAPAPVDTVRREARRLPAPPKGFSEVAGTLHALRHWFPGASSGQGSNAWAVRTRRGAVLANDPHLVLGLPARWYPVCILSPEYEVAGLTLPGLPLVVIGRNRSIAWGVTNLMADESDFFIERLDTADPRRYWDGTSWSVFQRRRDTIRVRGRQPVIVEITRSRNGPIISEVHLFAAPAFLFQRRSDTASNPFLRRWRLSYRWAAAEVASDEVLAAYRLGQARSWSEFRDALRHWGAPVLCFVYADARGTVAVQPAGYVPLRDSTLPAAAWMFPLPGWDERYRWRGLVQALTLPSLVNPRQEFVVSANHKLARSLPFPLSSIWEPPSRAQRLVELLLQREPDYGIADAEQMQLDVLSPYAREMLQRLLPLLDSMPKPRAILQRAFEQLRAWDFQFGRSSVGATIYAAFLQQLLHRTFGVHMSEARLREYFFLSNLALRRLQELLSTPSSPWFDNPRTQQRETLTEVAWESFAAAVEELQRRFGDNVAEWRYERLHRLQLQHVLGLHPLLRPLFSRGPYPSAGGPTTVNTGEWRLWAPFEQTLGASARFIADLSNATWAVALPGGVSGHFLSEHYTDQLPLWLYGGSVRSVVGIPPSARRALVLLPDRSTSLAQSP
jgi:penicillin amidase